MKYKINTIDVQAKEWFDKKNGNSYFSAVVTLNFGQPDQKSFAIPFQYGYGDKYQAVALHQLRTDGYIEDREHYALWRYCEENGVILRTSKQENCLKREVLAHTTYV